MVRRADIAELRTRESISMPKNRTCISYRCSFSKEAKKRFFKNAVSVFFVSPLAGSAFYHMTLFPLSDWLHDQESALWDAGVCKNAKKPKNAVSVFCRFGIL